MTDTKQDFNNAVHCELLLKPHRSMTSLGKKFFYASLGSAAVASNIYFCSKGWWPVALWIDATLGGLAGAVAWTGRTGKEYEKITLTDSNLEIRHYQPGWQAEDIKRLSPYMLQVEKIRDHAGTCTQILLKSYGKATEIGKFLGPNEKEQAADVLELGLKRAAMPAHLRPKDTEIPRMGNHDLIC